MIMFSKQTSTTGKTVNEADVGREATPTERPQEESRFDKIRRKAAADHRKSDTDGALRRARQTVEDNRLL